MATLGTLFAGSAWALGGEKKAKQEGPPINAQSTEEEKFIQFVAMVHLLVRFNADFSCSETLSRMPMQRSKKPNIRRQIILGVIAMAWKRIKSDRVMQDHAF